MHTMFQIENLQTSVLKPVSLKLTDNEVLTINGPSGAGKSLLLRAIADLDPNTGEIYLEQQARSQIPATRWRKQVAYLPTDSAWWYDTVKPHIQHWNQQLLKQLGFDQDVLDWSVSRLSSGEKQRLAIARLLSQQPKVLLLDEATANLDQKNIDSVETLIKQYQQKSNCIIIWVSHSEEQRQRVATQQASITAGLLRWN